jgi:bla regulator protein blaR1
VLLHETAHLAGYDDWSNLLMRVLGGFVALHPVAVWILRRIEREREMVCDDWVVARTTAARPYAATLARLFELRWARRQEALAPGLFGRGTRVGDRIEMLLRRGRTFSPRAARGPVIAGTALLGTLLVAGAFAPNWIAFAQPAPRLSYEVASVKRNTSGSDRVTHGGPPATIGFTASNMSLRMLMEIAYQVKDSQITGGPRWINSDRYDIAARPGESHPSAERSRAMLRTLLEDRFHLSIRRENKEIPVYVLLDSKSGRKLPGTEENRCMDPHSPNVQPPRPDELPRSPCEGFVMGPGFLASAKTNAPELADVLGNVLDRPVIDKTGDSAAFAVRLEFTPAGTAMSADADSSAGARPSLATAIQEQLGLKLESQRAAVEVLFIEHVEKPDAN